MAEKVKTVVRIAGHDYTLATEQDSVEHMHRVAVYVDRKMEEIASLSQAPVSMVPVLTALNIADELLKAHDENTRLRRDLMRRQVKQETAASKKTTATK